MGHIKSMLNPSQKLSLTARPGDFKLKCLTKMPLSILIKRHGSEVEPGNLHAYLVPQGNLLQVLPDQSLMSIWLGIGQAALSGEDHEPIQPALQSTYCFLNFPFPIHGGSRKRKKFFLDPYFLRFLAFYDF